MHRHLKKLVDTARKHGYYAPVKEHNKIIQEIADDLYRHRNAEEALDCAICDMLREAIRVLAQIEDQQQKQETK